MRKLILLLAVALILSFSTAAIAAETLDYTGTIQIFKKSKIVENFFKTAYAYAVFPAIGKAGFIIGGSFGAGQVYKGDVVTGRTKVFEGSIGLQIGGKAFKQIIFFKDKAAYDRFTSGSFEFGANVQATVVTAGAGAQAGTTGSTAGASATPEHAVQAGAEYINGMAVFVHSIGGLMAEFSISGQKFSFEAI